MFVNIPLPCTLSFSSLTLLITPEVSPPIPPSIKAAASSSLSVTHCLVVASVLLHPHVCLLMKAVMLKGNGENTDPCWM